MNSNNLIHQAKLNSWADTIRAQHDSGLSVSAWCDSHQLSKTQFYYWKRKLKDSYVESKLPEIVSISLPDSSNCCTTCTTDTAHPESTGLSLSIDGVSIKISPNTPDFLISRVIKAVRNA